MIYWIQIIYQFILPPGSFILLFLIYLIYERIHFHRRHLFCCFLLVSFYLLTTGLGAYALVKPLESVYAYPKKLDGDVLLMLGSGAAQHIPDVDGDGQPSPVMSKSMLTTAQLYEKTKYPILISGGGSHDVDISEAEIAKRNFRNLAIPDNKIFIEIYSRNTAENAKNSAIICREHNWEKPILLVAAMHAPRAALLFQREGIDVVVYPTYYRCHINKSEISFADFVPSSGNLDNAAMAIKEYLGILAIKIKLQ